MGQSSSTLRNEKRKPSRALRFSISKPKKLPLSATFNMLDGSVKKIDLLNINTASEEELMTLPGVNRKIASNIVEYRRIIGKFKRTDDLACVPEIGAEKLDRMRGEICVKRILDASDSVNSLDSICSQNSVSTYVDINKASIFDLQNIQGINQEIAANIVSYREKKGAFKSVDDLKKVKGINNIRFSVIRSHVMVLQDGEVYNNVTKMNGYIGSAKQDTLYALTDTQVDNAYVNTTSDSLNSYPLDDIFELLSTYSRRPPVTDFNYARNGKKAVRIASWNLSKFSLEKAQNFGVLEVCCRTILENRFSIIALQEVYDEEALKYICDQLNEPTLRRVTEWKENNSEWKYYKNKNIKYPNNLGFLYNSNKGNIDVELAGIEQIDIEEDVAESVLVNFDISDTNLLILNFYAKSKMSNFIDAIQKFLSANSGSIILGDFTTLFSKTETNGLDVHSCIPVLPLHTNTASVKTNLTSYYDNIFFSGQTVNRYAGFGSFVSEGLSHMAIPNGWSWGGVVSDHCPVWCDIYVSSNINNNNAIQCNGDGKML